jgi:hypothetical protein
MWADVLSTAPAGATYGFANPSIYAIAKDPARYGAAFTDITAGANGLNPALVGYDYVTGFGVPRLAGLITPGPGRDRDRRSRARQRRQRVRGPDRAGREVRAQAGGEGVAQAAVADRDRLGPRLPRPGRGAGQGRARGRRAARGQALSLPKGRRGFTRPRSCSERIFLAAKGTAHWRFAFRGHLARGRYSAYVRGTDAAGNVPHRRAKTAIRAFRVR